MRAQAIADPQPCERDARPRAEIHSTSARAAHAASTAASSAARTAPRCRSTSAIAVSTSGRALTARLVPDPHPFEPGTTGLTELRQRQRAWLAFIEGVRADDTALGIARLMRATTSTTPTTTTKGPP